MKLRRRSFAYVFSALALVGCDRGADDELLRARELPAQPVGDFQIKDWAINELSGFSIVETSSPLTAKLVLSTKTKLNEDQLNNLHFAVFEMDQMLPVRSVVLQPRKEDKEIVFVGSLDDFKPGEYLVQINLHKQAEDGIEGHFIREPVAGAKITIVGK